jgi:hypothetical protein
MKDASPTDRQRLVRVYVAGTLVLAVLLGWPAVSGAQRLPLAVVTFCECTCWYSGAGGKTANKRVTLTTDKSCNTYSGQTCYCDDTTCYAEYKTTARYKGALAECKSVSPMKQGEPSGTVLPRGQKRPAVQPPVSR